ncbi:MAG TPA: 16S rRNA (cytosine(967)-C(5))-methyltransferase RsmB [Terriglobales bacterium]|jgi:16S rRNA (cytosine967-C5)-methyltransferase
MPISPARIAAFEILLRVDRTDAYASELLHAPQHESLSPKDHGLATEIVMGTLRWRLALDRQIAQHCSQRLEKLDAEVLTALRMAAYQLQFLDRVPDRAAVHESVELLKRAKKRSATGLVNAVLRKLAAEKFSREKLSELDANPEWLVTRWANEFGAYASQKICSYNQTIPEASVRIYDLSAESELDNEGLKTSPGRILTSARRTNCGDITHRTVVRDGRVAIQDEGSQLIAMLVGKGERILDCCAAPGGKTRLIAHQNPNASVVALELYEHRAQLLRKRVTEKNVQVVTADATKFNTDHLFDRVLVDAPCSGTGTLAHNPEIKWRLRPEDLADLHARQLAILQSAMRLTAPGGRLAYATCSLEPEENARVVSEALSGNSSFHLLDCRTALESLRTNGDLAWDDLDSMLNGPYLRTVPGTHPCDGFFAAILERT